MLFVYDAPDRYRVSTPGCAGVGTSIVIGSTIYLGGMAVDKYVAATVTARTTMSMLA